MSASETGLPLSDDDRMWLARATVGRQSFTDWLASDPPADQVRAMFIRLLDRGGPSTVFSRVLSARLGVDPDEVYAENWPRKAAKLAAACRERGDHPHADKLHNALIALMFCANCGRPLVDPVSIDRGVGPDCWPRIDPAWRMAIIARLAIPEAS